MENIKVLRRQELETREVMVGDQILVSLAEIGDFTATAHKIADKGVLFIFDEYVTSRPMNNLRTNDGGYEKSALKKWIDTLFRQLASCLVTMTNGITSILSRMRTSSFRL